MRVFFASCTQGEYGSQNARIAAIEATLREQGHSVYSYIYDQQGLNDKRGYSELAEIILRHDIYIAEMSLPSQTLGFQIAFALSGGKPCLYLYDSATHGNPDAPLANHPSRLLRIASYTPTNLEKRLKNFTDYSKKQMSSKRMSFMSTYEIDRFLDQTSAQSNVPKSELIRNILNEAAQKYF